MERIFEKANPSIGLVIGTFAAVPHIHLQLESAKRNYPGIPILVHDDGSPMGERLGNICQQYGADFLTSAQRHKQFVGDLAAFATGFAWAKQRNLDLLVKFSRRFIPSYYWVRELQDLAFTTQYATYSSRCIHYGFGFRTECVAMHVNSWLESGATAQIVDRVNAEQGCFVEGFIHDLARLVHNNSCEQNRQYEKFGARPHSIGAYGDWLLAGISRQMARPDLLWHNYSSPDDYAALAKRYGLTYSAEDFADPNNGFGLGVP